MCYLVTFMSSAKENIKPEPYEKEIDAKERAAQLLTAGCWEVQLWKLHGTPKLKQTVTWENTDA